MIGGGTIGRAVTTAVVLGVVVTGCDPGARDVTAAARPMDDPAGLDIVFGHCRGESHLASDEIVAIEVRDESGRPTTTLAENPFPDLTTYDRILWSVQSDSPRSVDVATVGTTPDGFTEVVALTGPLPAQVTVVVRSYDDEDVGDGGYDLDVALDQLPADPSEVLDGDEVESRTDFALAVRQDECGQDVPAWFGPDLTPYLLVVLAASIAVFGVVALAARGRRRDA